MENNLDSLLKQANELRNGIEAMQQQSKHMGYNIEGIRECIATLQSGIKKVGNNKMAALAARDKRKVYDAMEDAIERLQELTGS